MTQTLTKNQILALPPGPEINALVAERVMGWRKNQPRHGSCCTCQKCGWFYDEMEFGCLCNFDPSTSWSDMGDVVEKICEDEVDFVLTYGEDGWFAQFAYRCPARFFDSDYCQFAPLAVSRAALLTTLEEKEC